VSGSRIKTLHEFFGEQLVAAIVWMVIVVA